MLILTDFTKNRTFVFLPLKVAETEASEMSCEWREVILVHFSAHVKKPGKGIPVLA